MRTMARYLVIAENYVDRAGRIESRTVGYVDADTLEQARRLATTYPTLKLYVVEKLRLRSIQPRGDNPT
jgi:hypothetical protein